MKKEAALYREIFRNPEKATHILYGLRKRQARQMNPRSFQSRKTNNNTKQNRTIVAGTNPTRKEVKS